MRQQNTIEASHVVGSDNIWKPERQIKMSSFWEKLKKKFRGIVECDIDHCLMLKETKNNLKKASANIDEVSEELRQIDGRMDELMATLDGEHGWFRSENNNDV
jgi:hypothetical protein